MLQVILNILFLVRKQHIGKNHTHLKFKIDREKELEILRNYYMDKDVDIDAMCTAREAHFD